MSGKTDSAPHGVVAMRTYLAVGAALLVLTAVTVAISFLPLGGWNAIVAVGVASIKALLVALVFMHLLYDRKLYLVVFVVAVLFLGVFIGLTMFDILRRGDIDPAADRPIRENAVIYNMAPPADSAAAPSDEAGGEAESRVEP
jgi:cytochrome c oxidase subunit 4